MNKIDSFENTFSMKLVQFKQYKYVFAWSFEDMKGLDPAFCQHQIHLNKDAKPV